MLQELIVLFLLFFWTAITILFEATWYKFISHLGRNSPEFQKFFLVKEFKDVLKSITCE
jgi:hypothetical protein